MANFGGHILTDAGRDYIAYCHAAGVAPVFSSVKVGDGVQYGSPAKLTALVNLKKSLSITETPKRTATGRFNITAVLNNSDVTAGFFLREWGVFCKKGEAEILYCYANSGNSADWITPFDGSTDHVSLMLTAACVVDGAENVTAVVGTPTLELIGAAPAIHTHAAADIVSGALPIAFGGTGAETAEAARIALGAASAAQGEKADAALPKTGGSMTGTLTAGGLQDELIAQVRNAVIAPAGTEDFSSYPNNCLIFVKKG